MASISNVMRQITKDPSNWIMHYLKTLLPCKLAIALDFRSSHGYFPNIILPKTFSEKIQSRKLYDRDSRFPLLADKFLVKDYVREKLGNDWVIPTIWAGKKLPCQEKTGWSPPFVVKANHGSGWNIFVFGNKPNWAYIESMCSLWLRSRWATRECEWLYSMIEPQIIVEPFIGENGKLPLDYKFFVFDGKVEFIQVDTNRDINHKRCFFDKNWLRQPFSLHYPLENNEIEKPNFLSEMIYAAEILAADIAFVRIDLYEIKRPLFGEMTFYPESGYKVFSPHLWDSKLGELWP